MEREFRVTVVETKKHGEIVGTHQQRREVGDQRPATWGGDSRTVRRHQNLPPRRLRRSSRARHRRKTNRRMGTAARSSRSRTPPSPPVKNRAGFFLKLVDSVLRYLYHTYISRTHHLTRKERDMKTIVKTTWHVIKDGEEIGRYASRKIAEAVAYELGGFVHKSTTECVQ